jgi:hypothetical protein
LRSPSTRSMASILRRAPLMELTTTPLLSRLDKAGAVLRVFTLRIPGPATSRDTTFSEPPRVSGAWSRPTTLGELIAFSIRPRRENCSVSFRLRAPTNLASACRIASSLSPCSGDTRASQSTEGATSLVICLIVLWRPFIVLLMRPRLKCLPRGMSGPRSGFCH